VKRLLSIVMGLILVAALALTAVYVHSRRQLAALAGQQAYASPEQGMRDYVSQHYAGLRRTEIVHAGCEPCFLNNLYFVEARVWADGRSDGKVVGQEGHNPGGFFLRRQQGWVWVPEEARPWFVALGQWLFGDS